MYQLHPPRRQSPGGAEFVNDCGGDVWANSNTSCPFAQNVREKWHENYPEGADGGEIDVLSPVTGQTYTMTCGAVGGGSGGQAGMICRGGNNAAVWFPIG
jgi:hypothetical protein